MRSFRSFVRWVHESPARVFRVCVVAALPRFVCSVLSSKNMSVAANILLVLTGLLSASVGILLLVTRHWGGDGS